jgi:threonine dehydratase
MKERQLPTLHEIESAAKTISGVACITPLVEAPALSKRFARQIFLKLECFQPTGAFKIRGAYNKISQVNEKWIVAASSGNHGIAVAYSSHLLGKKCTVVVPENAVEEKVSRIADFGAEVVKYGRFSEERSAKAKELAQQYGASFVHPFDDPEVIAGQGTCGLEIASQLEEFDSAVFPVGGGGLIAGSSIAIKAKKPGGNVFGVEPDGAPKLHEALKAGKPVTLTSPSSVADGLIPNSVSDLTFEAAKRNIAGSFTVTDDQIVTATKLLLKDAHVLAEPSGATPLALFLSGQPLESLGEKVVLVVSGGNISLSFLSQTIANLD